MRRDGEISMWRGRARDDAVPVVGWRGRGRGSLLQRVGRSEGQGQRSLGGRGCVDGDVMSTRIMALVGAWALALSLRSLHTRCFGGWWVVGGGVEGCPHWRWRLRMRCAESGSMATSLQACLAIPVTGFVGGDWVRTDAPPTKPAAVQIAAAASDGVTTAWDCDMGSCQGGGAWESGLFSFCRRVFHVRRLVALARFFWREGLL